MWSSIISIITCQPILLISRCWIARKRWSSCYGFSTFISYLGSLSRLEWKNHNSRHTSLTYFQVLSTTQLLILSPFTPQYTIHNSFLNISTTVTTINYNSKSLQRNIPAGTPAYVQSVTINGKPVSSRCHVNFYDAFRLGGDVVITLTANKMEVDSCLGALPDSLSTGGFAKAWWNNPNISSKNRIPDTLCLLLYPQHLFYRNYTLLKRLLNLSAANTNVDKIEKNAETFKALLSVTYRTSLGLKAEG